MTDPTEELRRIFAAKPRPTGWAERRARIDEVGAIDPAPADVTFMPSRIDGIPAEWSVAPRADPDSVVLFLHGGGYCSGSIASHRNMAAAIGRAAGTSALALGYRLAPEHPFPAALEDALTAVRFLYAMGFPPDRVAIAGDSAGGGLSLAVMVALRDAGEALPACAWLVSPWVDLEMTGATIRAKDEVDPLIHGPYLGELAQAYLAGHDPRDPLVSPLHADLAGLPPTLIQVGSSETLLDDAVRIAGALGAADAPVDARGLAEDDPRLSRSGRGACPTRRARWRPPALFWALISVRARRRASRRVALEGPRCIAYATGSVEFKERGPWRA